MAYSTTATIKTRCSVGLANLTDEESAPAILWADRRIDGRLRAKFTLPFASNPPEIEEISADLAAYFVLNERFIAGAEDTPVKAAEELYNRAMLELEAIIDGKVVPAVASTAAPVSSGMRSSTYGTAPSLRNFDGLNRPDYECPAGTPLAPMVRTVGQTVDNMAGDL